MGPAATVTTPLALRLELACDLAQVRPTAQTTRAFLASAKSPEPHALDCELALVEACNNAVEHCGKERCCRPILVDVLCDEHHTELRVTDHTAGFDWPARLALPSPESESGRGLFLIHSVMDYVGYFRGRGENILVMRKKNGPWGIHLISARPSTP